MLKSLLKLTFAVLSLPRDLPAISVICSNNEWFFFSARGKKRPGGSKKRRAAELGYWKATGREHDVRSGTDVIGTKRTLVYHLGRGTKGTRTEWMMNECSANVKDQNSLVVCHLRKIPMSRGHETSDKTSLSQRPMSANGSNVASVVLEQFAVAEAQSKKFSGSYDSRSVGKTDSDGRCKPKPKLSKAESSTRQKDMDAGEDFYEEILKDEIVNLDEHFITTNPGTLHNVPGSPEGERKSQELMEAILPSILPFHGTASRRIRLRKQMPRNTKASALRILRMNKKLNTRDKKGQRQQGT